MSGVNFNDTTKQASTSSGSAIWGDITGTLSDQTDLQTALDSKQNTLTIGNIADSAAGADGISITGGTGAVIGTGVNVTQQKSDATHPGYLAAADFSNFNSKVPSTRSVSTTAPLTGGGALSSDLTIVIPEADTSTDGYLASSDWNTFNNKQPTSYTPTTPSDWSVVPSTVSGALDQAVIQTNLYLSNTRYVDPVGGSDSTGNGTLNRPWKTLNFAMSQISPTFSNPFNIYLLSGGQYFEPGGTTHLKPNVNLLGGNQADVVMQTDVVVDTVAAADGFISINNIQIAGNFTYDGSTANTATLFGIGAYFNNLNYISDPSHNGYLYATGSTFANPTITGITSIQSTFFYGTLTFNDGCTEIDINGCVLNYATAISMTGNCTMILSGNSKIPSLTGTTSGGHTPALTSDATSIPSSVTGVTLTLSDDSHNLAYVPATPGDWASTPPTTVQQALDRMADLLKTLNSGVPIP